MHGRMPANARAGILAPWLGELGQAAFYAQIAQADEVFTDAFAQRFAELAEAVQLIWCRNDTWVPLARAKALVSVLPNARLEVIEDAGHLVQEDQPAALLTRLIEALA